MDYGRLIARSFEITFRYRALWLFGILFALFGGGNSPVNYTFGREDFSRPGSNFTLPSLAAPNSTLIAVVAAATCVALIFVILAFVLHLIGRGALIGLVNELETKQSEPHFRHGWNLGTGHFMPLLGIALVVNIPLAIVSLILVIIALLPMLGSILPLIESGTGTLPPQASGTFVAGIFASVALFCCVGLILIAVNLIIRPIYEFAVRASVISGAGVGASLREGYRRVRTNLGSVAFLYILVIGLGIIYGIVMIPVVLLLIGIPSILAVSTYFIANSMTPAIIVGVVLGIPILVLLFIITGFYHAFENNLWTEGYLALDRPATSPVPTPPADEGTLQPAQG